MTAVGLAVAAMAFPNPNNSPIAGDIDIHQISSSISFNYSIRDKIRTLSTTSTIPGNDISGFLYTPTLSSDSPCYNATQRYVPKNATRAENLPHSNTVTSIAFIGVAPWISPTCTLAYLNAATKDPVRAMVFFLPNDSDDIPPDEKSSTWSLGDGGKWKAASKFSVYTIPGASGSLILEQMALYSGNLTEAPHGHEIADRFPPDWYLRLAASVDIDGGSHLPTLWVFILIVLGILMVIIGTTSMTMHCITRRRRRILARRVVNGEVDLERLGIKRLTVPPSLLEKMPIYTFPTEDPEAKAHSGAAESKELPDSLSPTPEPDIEAAKAEIAPAIPPTPASKGKSVMSQTVCPICLDDYMPRQSRVRELPCRHIFHPECVDTFLRENSSLCPLCKKSCLPNGYCPPITYAMVRRERMLRRMGRLTTTNGRNDQQNRPGISLSLGAIRNRARDAFSRSPTQSPTPPVSTQLQRTTSVPQDIRQDSELARQRAMALLGRHPGGLVDPEAEDRWRPGWRRVVGRVWPGLA